MLYTIALNQYFLYYSSKSVAIYQAAIKQERMSSNILSHLHNKISPFLSSLSTALLLPECDHQESKH